MAASDSDPLSAAGLAAALEAGADASGTGGKPVSAGNLKALVDGGKIGAVDVLFRSDAGATTGTLSAPVEDYDVLVLMGNRHNNGYHICLVGNPYTVGATVQESKQFSGITVGGGNSNAPVSAYVTLSGTTMSTNGGQDIDRISRVVGIKL